MIPSTFSLEQYSFNDRCLFIALVSPANLIIKQLLCTMHFTGKVTSYLIFITNQLDSILWLLYKWRNWGTLQLISAKETQTKSKNTRVPEPTLLSVKRTGFHWFSIFIINYKIKIRNRAMITPENIRVIYFDDGRALNWRLKEKQPYLNGGEPVHIFQNWFIMI